MKEIKLRPELLEAVNALIYHHIKLHKATAKAYIPYSKVICATLITLSLSNNRVTMASVVDISKEEYERYVLELHGEDFLNTLKQHDYFTMMSAKLGIDPEPIHPTYGRILADYHHLKQSPLDYNINLMQIEAARLLYDAYKRLISIEDKYTRSNLAKQLAINGIYNTIVPIDKYNEDTIINIIRSMPVNGLLRLIDILKL